MPSKVALYITLAATLLACGEPELDDEQLQYVIFDPSGIGMVELTLSKADLATLQADPNAERYVAGDFRYTSPDGSVRKRITEVGVRYKGNTSLDPRLNKLPLKVRFNNYVSGQKFAGLKKIGFGTEYGDPTFIREALAYSTGRAAGIQAPRTQYVRIFVNGDDFGLYLMTEEEDDVFLASHFEDGDGNLYKVTRGPLLYWGTDVDDYQSRNGSYSYDEGPDNNPSFGDLIGLARTFSLAPVETFAADVAAEFDVERWLKDLAVDALQVNLDGPAYSANNYYLYDDPSDGLFRLISWDMDSSFGAFPPTATAQQKADLDIYRPKLTDDPRPLVDRILSVKKWQSAYLSELETLHESVFAPEDLEAEAIAMFELIEPELANDPKLIYGYDAFVEGFARDVDAADPVRRYPQPFPGLVPFFRARYEAVEAQLAQPPRWPTASALVEVSGGFDVDLDAAIDPRGKVYVYVLAEVDGVTQTYLVREKAGDAHVKFNTVLSLPESATAITLAAFLDVDDDDWIDPGTDYFGTAPAAVTGGTLDAAVTIQGLWAGDAVWASKYGAPIGL